jgi:hypothetical protein
MPAKTRDVRAVVAASLDAADATHQFCLAELTAGAELVLMSGPQAIEAALAQERLRSDAMEDTGVPTFGVERFLEAVVEIGTGRLLMGYVFGENYDCHLALSWPDNHVIGVWAAPADRPMRPC